MAQKNSDPQVRVRHFGRSNRLRASASADAFFVVASAKLDLGLSEPGEGLTELVVDHFIVGDVELLEDRLVQLTPELGARSGVQLVRSFEQPQRRLDRGDSDGQGVVRVFERLAKAVTFSRDLGESRSEPILRTVVLRCQVVQVLLLLVELGDASLELIAEKLGGLSFVGDRLL